MLTRRRAEVNRTGGPGAHMRVYIQFTSYWIRLVAGGFFLGNDLRYDLIIGIRS
jgi:hypothetical protein